MSSYAKPAQLEVTVYGRDWCEDTQETRRQLDSLGVPYLYIDIDQNAAAAAWVDEQGRGKRRTPTVAINGGVLIEPDEETLEESLRQAANVAQGHGAKCPATSEAKAS